MYHARHVVDELDTPRTETTGLRSCLSRQPHKGEHHPLSVTRELLGDTRAPAPQETVEKRRRAFEGDLQRAGTGGGTPLLENLREGRLLHAKLPSDG